MATKTKSKHIFYFDALRALAILCVVLLHAKGFMTQFVTYTPEVFFTPIGFWELFSHNPVRIGVDLFLMLSGALSLGRDWEIKDFLGKRLPRIIKPFVFWCVVGSSTLIAATYFIPQLEFISSFTLESILGTVYNTFLFKTPCFSPYWFFWMILGTYLIMPIFNKWLLHSDLKEVEYFLIIWVISTIFEYTLMKSCPVNLSYFTSPIGVVVLGYYLRHTKRRIFNNKYIAIAMILIPMIIMVAYSYHVLDSEMFFKFNRYSILMIIEVTGVFCLFKCSNYLKNPNIYLKKFVGKIAKCSYGMYLTHAILIFFVGKLIPFNIFQHTGTYLIILAIAFFGSLTLINTLGKIPIIQDFVGVK